MLLNRLPFTLTRVAFSAVPTAALTRRVLASPLTARMTPTLTYEALVRTTTYPMLKVLLMGAPVYLFAYPSTYDQAIGPRGVVCVRFLTT